MFKRIFDILISSLGLIILSPLFLLISVWIKFDSKGPIIFRQTRVGLKGKEFRIHKFRTMIADASKLGGSITIGSDKRITHVGKFLRKYKLDELPQLIDVFLGNMSLVGPRPEVPEFMNKYPDGIREKILSVRPGITDLASIEMIDENEVLSSYDDPQKAYVEFIMPLKANYYIKYAESHTLFGDIGIVIKTIAKILFR
ncbi:sugar transferase [Taylorella equigenitalis]|nr:sugar transferase [Taylorella equigenitalis]AFN35507.1 glycosyltransferase [Taylorella equigenitalis ATCC 35865]ASY30158.1 glycosyltransferase [Taylorella equigenitalis]ASY37466.1 sugar transferase [Taylorella equigenitalis]ASY38935.1 sugar transferase [Taylorella equigenitalis]ASY40454.1 glycosyltransferase [Taylorella equigenitalis]